MTKLTDIQLEEIDSQAVNRNQYINADVVNKKDVDKDLITSTATVVNEIIKLIETGIDINGTTTNLVEADTYDEFIMLAKQGKFVYYRHGKGIKATALFSNAAARYLFDNIAQDQDPTRRATIIKTAFDVLGRSWRIEYTARYNEVKPCEEGNVSETDFQGVIERIAYSIFANHYLSQELEKGIISQEQFDRDVVDVNKFNKTPTLEEASSLDIYWRINQRLSEQREIISRHELENKGRLELLVSGARVILEVTQENGEDILRIRSSRDRAAIKMSNLSENFVGVLPNMDIKVTRDARGNIDTIILKRKLVISGSTATHQLLVEDIFGTPITLLTPSVFNPIEFTEAESIDADFIREKKLNNTDSALENMWNYLTSLTKKTSKSDVVKLLTDNILASHKGDLRGVLAYIHDVDIYMGVMTQLKERGFAVVEITRALHEKDIEIKALEEKRAEYLDQINKKSTDELKAKYDAIENQIKILKLDRENIIKDEVARLETVNNGNDLFLIDSNTPQELINAIANNAGGAGGIILTYNAKTQIGVDYRGNFDRHDYGASIEDVRTLLQGKGRINRQKGNIGNRYFYLLNEDISDSLENIKLSADEFSKKLEFLKSKVDAQDYIFDKNLIDTYSNNLKETIDLLNKFIKRGPESLSLLEKFQLNAYYRYFVDTSESALFKVEESLRGYWQGKIKDVIDELPEDSKIREKIQKIYQKALDRESKVTESDLFADTRLKMLTPEERLRKVFEAELERGKLFMDEVTKALSGIKDISSSNVRVAKKYATQTHDEIENVLNRVRSTSLQQDAKLTAENTSALVSCLSLEDIYNTAIGRFLRYVMPGREVENLTQKASKIVQKYKAIETEADLMEAMQKEGATANEADQLLGIMKEHGWVDSLSGAIVSENVFKAIEILKQINKINSESDKVALRRLLNRFGKTSATGSDLPPAIIALAAVRGWVSASYDIDSFIENLVYAGSVFALDILSEKDQEKFEGEISSMLRSYNPHAYLSNILVEKLKIRNKKIKVLVKHSNKIAKIEQQIQALDYRLSQSEKITSRKSEEYMSWNQRLSASLSLKRLKSQLKKLKQNDPRSLSRFNEIARSLNQKGLGYEEELSSMISKLVAASSLEDLLAADMLMPNVKLDDVPTVLETGLKLIKDPSTGKYFTKVEDLVKAINNGTVTVSDQVKEAANSYLEFSKQDSSYNQAKQKYVQAQLKAKGITFPDIDLSNGMNLSAEDMVKLNTYQESKKQIETEFDSTRAGKKLISKRDEAKSDFDRLRSDIIGNDVVAMENAIDSLENDARSQLSSYQAIASQTGISLRDVLEYSELPADLLVSANNSTTTYDSNTHSFSTTDTDGRISEFTNICTDTLKLAQDLKAQFPEHADKIDAIITLWDTNTANGAKVVVSPKHKSNAEKVTGQVPTVVFDADFAEFIIDAYSQDPMAARWILFERLGHELTHASYGEGSIEGEAYEEFISTYTVDYNMGRMLEENQPLKDRITKLFTENKDKIKFSSGHFYRDIMEAKIMQMNEADGVNEIWKYLVNRKAGFTKDADSQRLQQLLKDKPDIYSLVQSQLNDPITLSKTFGIDYTKQSPAQPQPQPKPSSAGQVAPPVESIVPKPVTTPSLVTSAIKAPVSPLSAIADDPKKQDILYLDSNIVSGSLAEGISNQQESRPTLRVAVYGSQESVNNAIKTLRSYKVDIANINEQADYRSITVIQRSEYTRLPVNLDNIKGTLIKRIRIEDIANIGAILLAIFTNADISILNNYLLKIGISDSEREAFITPDGVNGIMIRRVSEEDDEALNEFLRDQIVQQAA